MSDRGVANKICPIMSYQYADCSHNPGKKNCVGPECACWVVIYDRVEREDHSGARDRMNDLALETRRHVEREGPPGSIGILILREVGRCGLINVSEKRR